MPRTNHSQERQATRSLGFFLQCNGDSDSTTWSCHATAELRLIPQKEGTEQLSRKIQHVFYGKENDWGFSHFQTMSVRFIVLFQLFILSSPSSLNRTYWIPKKAGSKTIQSFWRYMFVPMHLMVSVGIPRNIQAMWDSRIKVQHVT